MTDIVSQKIERHNAFLERRNRRPLLGCIRGWENFAKYVPHPETFMPVGRVSIDALTPDLCSSIYEDMTLLQNDDDLFRTAEPLTFFPWAEAAMGCPVEFTGRNFWSSPIERAASPTTRKTWIEELERGRLTEQNRPWIEKYGTLLAALSDRLGDEFPVGQAILRGPLDMAAAAFGDEAMIYLFFDEPDLMKRFLDLAARLFMDFVEVQRKHVPPFAGGTVIGSYYIWTPGSGLRLQEDAMALLSPELYKTFIHPIDRMIAAEAEGTLFHLHATGLHLLDALLRNEHINILQVSKDEGVNLKAVLPNLRTIQAAGKCLVVKGRFTLDELQDLRNALDPRGLCIQAVVLNSIEAETFFEAFE